MKFLIISNYWIKIDMFGLHMIPAQNKTCFELDPLMGRPCRSRRHEESLAAKQAASPNARFAFCQLPCIWMLLSLCVLYMCNLHWLSQTPLTYFQFVARTNFLRLENRENCTSWPTRLSLFVYSGRYFWTSHSRIALQALIFCMTEAPGSSQSIRDVKWNCQ